MAININLKQLIFKKQLEENKSISVVEVVKKTGISHRTISMYLQNKNHNITAKNIEKLCRYFNCEISDLLDLDPSLKNDPE